MHEDVSHVSPRSSILVSSPSQVAVDARKCQPLLAPLVHVSFVGSYYESLCCPFAKMEWDHVVVQPEPELSADCIKPQGLDNSRRAESWIDISGLV